MSHSKSGEMRVSTAYAELTSPSGEMGVTRGYRWPGGQH